MTATSNAQLSVLRKRFIAWGIHMTRPISRRSVARGAAGSIPAVTVAGAAPVMAASTCGAPTPRVSGGVIYDWGDVSASTTNQSLNVGAPTCVDNLPAGVTVAR